MSGIQVNGVASVYDSGANTQDTFSPNGIVAVNGASNSTSSLANIWISNTNGNNYNVAGNWFQGDGVTPQVTPPVSTSIVIINQPMVVVVGNTALAQSIQISSGGSLGTASAGAATLQVAAGGITIDPNLGSVVLGSSSNILNINFNDGTNPVEGIVNVGSGTSLTINNTVSGGLAAGNGLTLAGAGMLTLATTGANTYAGNTTVAGGVLSIGADNQLGTGTNVLIGDNATLQVTSSFPSARTVTFGGGATATPLGAGGTIDINGANTTLTLTSPIGPGKGADVTYVNGALPTGATTAADNPDLSTFSFGTAASFGITDLPSPYNGTASASMPRRLRLTANISTISRMRPRHRRLARRIFCSNMCISTPSIRHSRLNSNSRSARRTLRTARSGGMTSFRSEPRARPAPRTAIRWARCRRWDSGCAWKCRLRPWE